MMEGEKKRHEVRLRRSVTASATPQGRQRQRIPSFHIPYLAGKGRREAGRQAWAVASFSRDTGLPQPTSRQTSCSFSQGGGQLLPSFNIRHGSLRNARHEAGRRGRTSPHYPLMRRYLRRGKYTLISNFLHPASIYKTQYQMRLLLHQRLMMPSVSQGQPIFIKMLPRSVVHRYAPRRKCLYAKRKPRKETDVGSRSRSMSGFVFGSKSRWTQQLSSPRQAINLAPAWFMLSPIPVRRPAGRAR